jgi:hypothetical protein
MTSVEPEAQWYTTLPVFFTTKLLARCEMPIATYSTPKTTSVGPEPQWHITQPAVFTIRPFARCLTPIATD